MKLFEKFEKLDKAIEYVVTVIMIILVTLSFVSVFFRYILHISIFWADEFLRYALIWMVFLAAPVLAYQKGHLMVNMTTMFFPKKLHKIAYTLGYLMTIAFLAIMVPDSIKLVGFGVGQISAAMKLNMGYVYSCIPVSLVLTIIGFTRIMILELMGKSKESDFIGEV